MVEQNLKETSFGFIPEDWELKPLNELGEVTGGTTPKRSNPEFWGGEIPWLTPSEITDNIANRVDETKEYLTEMGLDSCSVKVLPPGTVMLTSRATIGECVINEVPMATNQGFANIICDNEKIYNHFLLYLLEKISPRLEALAGGSTFLEISRTSVRSLNVPVPPLPEQKKMADILSSVDKAIGKTDEIIEKTEKLKKGLMQKLLTKGIEHDEFKETILGTIPQSWEIKQMRNICNKITDGTHDTPPLKDNGYPFVTAKNITNGKLDFSDCNYVSSEEHKKIISRSKPEQGDILFTHIGTIGEVVEVDVNFEFSIKNVALFKPDNNQVKSRYFKFSLESNIVQNFIQRILQGGVQQYLSLKTLRGLNVPVPPLQEQKKIASILSSVDKKIQKEKEYKEKLEHLKKGLMQKLLTGEVRVEVDEDEYAQIEQIEQVEEAAGD
ncbi:restriction endonuclease subunit S [Halarsenatibacter silvermanii]|uniref:Type I restriction enzyme, S subunit n=1 Tax=Halarsenatibacter silvermanii TaxID=321763 RepID=A0A1G9M541_9FIRM|nr:restriction endonuclease subunit S [Halarsenatibacter silvermanii]SDL68795.1 type I restriction enzyme, S subunit [Halarsenatibacter silvermanii]